MDLKEKLMKLSKLTDEDLIAGIAAHQRGSHNE
jgi:hypothetical protein